MAETSLPKRPQRLVEEAARGDEEAWRQIVSIYTPRIYGLLVRQCRDRDLAEEITQATFVKVVTSLERYTESGHFDAWLFRIAMNELRDEMRRRKRQAEPMDMRDGAGRDADPNRWAAESQHIEASKAAPGPLAILEAREKHAHIRAEVDAMSDADREILHLRYTAELTYAEIAETLDEPLGTVLARGHRAIRKL